MMCLLQKISLLDALKCIKLSWHKLPVHVISNCFRKSLRLNIDPIINDCVPDIFSDGDLFENFEKINNLERFEITSSLETVDKILKD